MENINFAAICFFISFFYIGLKFPDVDLKIKGLRHRSILTHSFFLPVILFGLHVTNTLNVMWQSSTDITGTVIAGLSFGMTLHFLYDLRPKKFVGSALIQFPFTQGYKKRNALNAAQTVMWLIGSSVIQSLISVYYISSYYEMTVLIVCTACTLYFKRNSEKGFYSVIFMFIAIFFLSFYLRNFTVSLIDLF
jgi:hypothetical protein ilyop_1485